MNKRIALLEVKGSTKTFRYATERVILSTTNEDGNSVPIVYLPYILKFPELKSTINIEGKTPVPSTNVSAYDGDRDFASEFVEKDYESAECKVTWLDEDHNIVSELNGYMTGVKYNKGNISFTVRSDEDKISANPDKIFSYDSFQHQEILQPADAQVEVSLDLRRDVPWKTMKLSLQRTFTWFQDMSTADPSSSLTWNDIAFRSFTKDDGSLGSALKLGTKDNKYIRYTTQDGFFIRCPLATNGNNYQVRYDGTTYSYLAGPTDTTISIIEGIADQINAGGFYDASVIDNRLFIAGLYSLLDTAFGSFVPTAGGIKYMEVYIDPDSGGTAKTLVGVKFDLFDDPNGTDYALAIVGNTEWQERTEVIAYSYCKQNQIWDPDAAAGAGALKTVNLPDDLYYLSGIPTHANPDPAGTAAAIIAADPDISNLTEFVDKYGLVNRHDHAEIVSPSDGIDKVYVADNGLKITSIDDPELGAGFINVGSTVKDQNDNEYLKFHRYKVSNILTEVYDDNIGGRFIDEVYELEIHVRNPELVEPVATSPHTYYVGTENGTWEFPPEVDRDNQVNLASWDMTLSTLDLLFSNVNEDIYQDASSPQSEVYRLTRNRFKGLRVDMIDDFDSLVTTLATSQTSSTTNATPDNIKKVNASLVNNATGDFGVCYKSELVQVGDYIYERLYFFTQEDRDGRRTWVAAVDSSPEATGDVSTNYAETYDGDSKRSDYYVNYFLYKPEYGNASEQENVASELVLDARAHFKAKKYRILHEPVPENSEDLGRMFPIVYGQVVRVPLLQCISKKAFGGNTLTAGDDFYVYASHPCDVATPQDIVLEIFRNNTNEQNVDFNRRETANFKYDLVRSPFPNYVENHSIVEEGATYEDYRVRNSGRLMNPYHRQEERPTLQGDTTYGIRIRGAEWDARAGKLDKRYPIRFGLGSTRLYGTFAGWVDNNQNLIDHPLDVLRHYIKYYGKYPYTIDSFDDRNFELAKSKTRQYKAAIFLDQPIDTSMFVQKIMTQFALFPYLLGGKINASIINFDIIDWNSPLIEGLNINNDVVEDQEGYKKIYKEIIYNYKKNYVSGKFDEQIHLHKGNNKFCARAAKTKGGGATFKVDADFVNDFATAKKVANRYAKFLGLRSIKYTFTLKYNDGLRYTQGSVVPMTYSKFGLDETPVVITSIQEGLTSMKMEVIRFIDED